MDFIEWAFNFNVRKFATKVLSYLICVQQRFENEKNHLEESCDNFLRDVFDQNISLPVEQGFGAGAARSRGIWLEPEPSLWPGSGSGSSLNFSSIIHANCVIQNLFSRVENKLVTIYTVYTPTRITSLKKCLKSMFSGAGAGSRNKFPEPAPNPPVENIPLLQHCTIWSVHLAELG